VTGFLLGSIAGRVSAHARCPVLMARGAPRPGGPVVVGVDGSAHSIGALAFAAEEASLRKTDLVAVHAWTGPVAVEPGDMLPLVFDPAELAAEETRLLAEAVAGLSDDYPDLTITRRVVRGRAAHTLIDHSRIAQLVVVGAKGRGRFAGLPLGSVSQALLRHADCPVAVVR
jgi:nucleotide-binding universal stress UspA family protein